MTVSVLVATYQGAPFIAAQLESLLHQTYSNLQILVRDDGSKDTTREIVEKMAKRFPEKLSLLQETGNLGIQGNFSRLMEVAPSTPYIAFCDQDDWWKADKIAVSVQEMQRLETIWGQQTPLLVHTDLEVVDRDLGKISPSFWDYCHISPQKDAFPRLLNQNVVTGCTMLINRPLLEKAWPIPQEAWMHDWWIALVACCFGKISSLPAARILYRQHGNNDTGARPYYQRIFTKRRCRLADTCRQAEALFHRYSDSLSPSLIRSLSLYCQLPKKGELERRWLIYQEGFWKQGWLRNLPHILFG